MKVGSTEKVQEHKSVSVQPDELDGGDNECSCQFRYETALIKYKNALNIEHKNQIKSLQLAMAKQVNIH